MVQQRVQRQYARMMTFYLVLSHPTKLPIVVRPKRVDFAFICKGNCEITSAFGVHNDLVSQRSNLPPTHGLTDHLC